MVVSDCDVNRDKARLQDCVGRQVDDVKVKEWVNLGSRKRLPNVVLSIEFIALHCHKFDTTSLYLDKVVALLNRFIVELVLLKLL